MRMEPVRPFYTPPACVLKTSAEIIREARTEMSARLVDTKRPFTPRVKDRRLFGNDKHGLTSRPPSSFSLRQVEFSDVESVRLPPIRSPPVPSKPPWLPHTASLSNLVEEVEVEGLVGQGLSRQEVLRQTHSSPQERTCGEGLPRVRHTALVSWRERGPGTGRRSRGRRSRATPLSSSISEAEEEQRPVDILSLEPAHGPPRHSTLRHTPSRPDILTLDTPPPSTQEDKSVLLDLLSQIEDLNEKENYEEALIELLDKLYILLRKGNTKRSNKLNSQIIKTLYTFVETGSDTVVLYVARVILALRLSGQNLSAVNKLIFKVSRTDKNDALFLDADILELFVETLGCASPLEDAEACIYGYGALKFLTMNNQVVQLSMKLGIIELMALHMKIVNNARLELLPIPEQTSHAMFQLTGTVRNIAGDETSLRKFIKSGLISQMCISMEIFSADLDLISNIARTLSIISTNESCCEAIVQHERSFTSIIKIFTKYPGRQDIIVRLGYALGNIIAKNESSRLKLYSEHGLMAAVLGLLGNYLDKDLELMKSCSSPQLESNSNHSPQWASDGSVEDVIVKMIRIVANMSMSPEVGVTMTCLPGEDYQDSIYSSDQHNSRDSGKFLDMLLMILRRKSVCESEELVMSALTTLNNLSFYAEPSISSEGPFAVRQLEIAQVLSTLLLTNNEESMVEVTRVLGNLTRSKDVRDYILEIGGVSQLVRCLDYSNRELLYTTTGVLVNLMADWDKRLAFKENNGIHRLIQVLVREGERDWRLASLICQALWNFCIDSSHLYAALGVQPTNHLLSVLVDLTDEESLFGVTEGSSVPESVSESAEYRSWEQFATVATNLLEKIEQYLESLQAFQDQQ